MEGWNTIVSFGARPIFRGKLLVSGGVDIIQGAIQELASCTYDGSRRESL